MTSPFMFNSAPPELPGLMAALVWMKVPVAPFSRVISRFRALTIPLVTDWPYPRALPIAITGSPSFRSSLLPKVATVMAFLVSSLRSFKDTAITARSISESSPLTCACASLPSIKVTFSVSALSTTWLLDTISSSSSVLPTMIPEPLAASSCVYCCPKTFAVSVKLFTIDTIAGITFSTTSDTSDST